MGTEQVNMVAPNFEGAVVQARIYEAKGFVVAHITVILPDFGKRQDIVRRLKDTFHGEWTVDDLHFGENVDAHVSPTADATWVIYGLIQYVRPHLVHYLGEDNVIRSHWTSLPFLRMRR